MAATIAGLFLGILKPVIDDVDSFRSARFEPAFPYLTTAACRGLTAEPGPCEQSVNVVKLASITSICPVVSGIARRGFQDISPIYA